MATKNGVKNKTRKTYDVVGAQYDSWYWTEGSKKLREGLKEKTLSVIKESIKGKKPEILDVCCGTGYLAGELSKLGDYTGVDFAEGMVDFCKKRYPKDRFIVADAEGLPFKDRSFDIVVCFWSFHHLTDPEKAMDEFSRVLKGGGLLVIATFKDTKFNIMARVADLVSSGYYGFQTYRYSKGEMGKLLEERFKSFEIEIFPKSGLVSFWDHIGVRFLLIKAFK